MGARGREAGPGQVSGGALGPGVGARRAVSGPRPAALLAGPGRPGGPRGAPAASFREASGQRGGGRAWAVLAGARVWERHRLRAEAPRWRQGRARREVGGAPKLGSLARPAPAAASPRSARCCGHGCRICGFPKRWERGGAVGRRREQRVGGQPAHSPAAGHAPAGVRQAPWALLVAGPGLSGFPRGWWRWLG